MPGGRPNKPLFELLRDESTGRRTQPLRPSPMARPPAIPEAELKPVQQSTQSLDPDSEAVPESSMEETDAAPRPSGHRPALFRMIGETVQISRYTALIACAVILGVIFVIYIVAFNAGREKAAKESARSLPPDSPPPAGALTNTLRPTETLGQREPEPAAKPPPPKPKPIADKGKPTPPVRLNPGFDDPTKPILTATGAIDADPRVPDQNYLVLATLLTREDARQLVEFLGANGLETVGVPGSRVEGEGRTANNPVSYKVVSLRGLTKEQLKADDPLKARLTAEGTRLGELWKDQKKRLIIKDTYWEKLPKP